MSSGVDLPQVVVVSFFFDGRETVIEDDAVLKNC
jgi:hypothetical protein